MVHRSKYTYIIYGWLKYFNWCSWYILQLYILQNYSLYFRDYGMRSGHKKWVQYWGIVLFSMVDYISQEKWLLLHDFPTIAFILFLINYSYSSSRRHNIKKSKNNKKNQNTIKKIISKIFWYFTRLLWLRIEHRRYDILYIHIQTVVKNGRLYSNIKSMIKILWQGHHVTW